MSGDLELHEPAPSCHWERFRCLRVGGRYFSSKKYDTKTNPSATFIFFVGNSVCLVQFLLLSWIPQSGLYVTKLAKRSLQCPVISTFQNASVLCKFSKPEHTTRLLISPLRNSITESSGEKQTNLDIFNANSEKFSGHGRFNLKLSRSSLYDFQVCAPCLQLGIPRHRCRLKFVSFKINKLW